MTTKQVLVIPESRWSVIRGVWQPLLDQQFAAASLFVCKALRDIPYVAGALHLHTSEQDIPACTLACRFWLVEVRKKGIGKQCSRRLKHGHVFSCLHIRHVRDVWCRVQYLHYPRSVPELTACQCEYGIQ